MIFDQEERSTLRKAAEPIKGVEPSPIPFQEVALTRLLETVAALARCKFLPGSTDKRFARDVASIVSGGFPLTEKQQAHVLRLAYKYRRQMPPGLVPKARPPHAWERSSEDTAPSRASGDGTT